MKFLFAIAVLIAAATLSGCGKNAAMESTEAPNGFKAELIGNADGCRIWRFTDAMRYVYFTKCGAEQNVKYATGGKHSSDIQTVGVN